jgi:hypothetical protein
MAMPTSGAVPVAGSEPRTRTALLLEGIALRHQIAVLERSGTRRPCFRLWDRLFWILFSRWWPQWRDSLIIVQPETALRWRRNGWSALWRYRARGRWRGGRPRVSSEVRQLIAQMACVWRIADSGEISNSPHTRLEMAASGLNAMDPRRTPEKVLTGHPDPADLVASFEDDERFAACSPKFQRRDQPRETRASCAGNRLRARHLNSIFVPGEQKIVELVPQLVFVVRNQ